jgi:hypothetical protein
MTLNSFFFFLSAAALSRKQFLWVFSHKNSVTDGGVEMSVACTKGVTKPRKTSKEYYSLCNSTSHNVHKYLEYRSVCLLGLIGTTAWRENLALCLLCGASDPYMNECYKSLISSLVEETADKCSQNAVLEF